MIELEEQVRESLEAWSPPEPAVLADWQVVLDRAAEPPSRPRRLRLAVAFAALVALLLGVTPLGGALARAVGDFSGWLRGDPGTPAAPAEQQAFEQQSTGRLGAFPHGTKLRRLLETTVDGARYTLYGFRSGDSLCLRLIWSVNAERTIGCVPRYAIEQARTDAVVVRVDEPFGTPNRLPPRGGYLAPRASASFGIVADGVTSVELESDSGRHRALVGGNSFLYVQPHPKVGERTRHAWATNAAAQRVALPLALSPFGTEKLPPAPKGQPQGPAKVERHVTGGRIGWLEQREPRGQPWQSKRSFGLPLGGRMVFARVVAPDPQNHMRVLLGLVNVTRPRGPLQKPGLQLCYGQISGSAIGGGCSPTDMFFAKQPFGGGITSNGSSQYVTLAGLATDQVARLALFLTDGRRLPVPMRDNAYLIQAPRTSFPIRLVAYDARGRVIGIETYRNDGMSRVGPQPLGRYHVILSVRAADGELATIAVAAGSGGATCYRSLYGAGGASSSGCIPKHRKGPKLTLGVSSSGRNSFLGGNVAADIATVELRYADGNTTTITPVQGFALAAIPDRHTGRGHQLIAAVGRDAHGHEIARQRLQLPFP